MYLFNDACPQVRAKEPCNLRRAILLHCTLQSVIMRITSQAEGGLDPVATEKLNSRVIHQTYVAATKVLIFCVTITSKAKKMLPTSLGPEL